VCQGRNQFRLGTCSPPPPPPQQSPPPGHVPGEGKACGPVTLGGGVKKHRGCPKGLQCRNNQCRKLEVELQGMPGKLAGHSNAVVRLGGYTHAARGGAAAI
jgi:hypothetical protein